MAEPISVIPGIYSYTSDQYFDDRGYFTELYSSDRDATRFKGIKQISRSVSKKNVIRGLHFQVGMSKAIRVLQGSAEFVWVDLRFNSPYYGKYVHQHISADPLNFYYSPGWAAIGFRTLDEMTAVEYFHCCKRDTHHAFTIAWNDPTIGIEWNIDNPILSEKDQQGISLIEWENSLESKWPQFEYSLINT